MVTIRCTQKLLRRVDPTPGTQPPTTRLGDWYATILFARPEQLVVCVSERTLLAVVVPARPASALGKRLSEGLAEVLTALGVSATQIAHEVREMSECSFARTQSRSVLGSLNELVFHLSEPPRDSRRLQTLRGWSHEYVKEVSCGGPGARGPAGLRARR